jgi:hypothetical protein
MIGELNRKRRKAVVLFRKMPGVTQVTTNELYVSFQVFIAVTMKDAVFWDVTPCR